jgi:ElaB/YqjD/DUF883 family membrane-anchored ribosome-binding protein
MSDEPASSPPPPSSGQRIPDELVQALDQANATFHESKQHMEAEMDSFEPDHERRLEKTRAELHEAEKHVEVAAEQIHQAIDALKSTPKKAGS